MTAAGCGTVKKDASYEKAGKDQVIVYSPYDSRLCVYDKKEKRNMGNLSCGSGPLYEFQDTRCGCYAVTDEDEMYVARLTDDRKKTEKTVSFYSDEIYPIAYDNDSGIQYYISQRSENEDDRNIISVDRKGKTETLLRHAGMVTSGAYTDRRLYYTRYNKKKDDYSLLELRNGTVKDTGKILKTDDLYVRNGKLLCSDDRRIYDPAGDYSTTKSDFTYFIDDLEMTVRMDIGKNNRPELTVSGYDGKIREKAEDAAGFYVEKDKLVICAKNRFERVSGR